MEIGGGLKRFFWVRDKFVRMTKNKKEKREKEKEKEKERKRKLHVYEEGWRVPRSDTILLTRRGIDFDRVDDKIWIFRSSLKC